MITIKEIASKAGVSPGTVDRVLHNRGRVSKESAERVRLVAREAGYVPNLFAKRLKEGRSLVFGVLYMLAPYATFSTANMIRFDKLNAPQWGVLIAGVILSLFGMGIGHLIYCVRSKRSR